MFLNIGLTVCTVFHRLAYISRIFPLNEILFISSEDGKIVLYYKSLSFIQNLYLHI